jgi:hypothetical protein
MIVPANGIIVAASDEIVPACGVIETERDVIETGRGVIVPGTCSDDLLSGAPHRRQNRCVSSADIPDSTPVAAYGKQSTLTQRVAARVAVRYLSLYSWWESLQSVALRLSRSSFSCRSDRESLHPDILSLHSCWLTL